MNLIKMKNFCSSKDRIKNTKKCAIDGEKIFMIHITNKEPIQEYRKNFKSDKTTQ